MNYESLLIKIEKYKQKYDVKVIGTSVFGRKIFAVEKNVNSNFFTAIFVAGVHAREHIATDLLCKMIDENLFDEIYDFNLSFVLMANPDGVCLSTDGILSAPVKYRENLIEINKGSFDFLLWKANGRGVDINNNFDALWAKHKASDVPASQGFVGERFHSEPETIALVNYAREKNLFLSLSYHSKGEEIYYNFFQKGKILIRDKAIAEKWASSTGYQIKNPENISSGGFKDFCVMRLGCTALTIEIGDDRLSHPISSVFLNQIFLKHKEVAKNLQFAYNVFRGNNYGL